MRRSRNIIVVLGVLFLCLCFSPHPALSTEPLDPPFEGAFIENTTDVNVYGNFREKESLIHDQSSGEVVIIIETEEGCGKKTEVYHSSLSQAESTYSDEVTASDGDTLFSKTFTFDTHPADGSPNIGAERDIGFSPASLMSGIDAAEKASLSIGHNLGFTECVEQTQQESLICIKGQNECLGIAAGSAFHATTLSAHSDTAVTVTATPSLYHHVNASGEGSATAELVFSQTNAATLDITADCASMDCPAKGGSHLVVFSEKTHADGIFSPFRKDLYATVSESYQTGAQPSFFSGALTLDTLCPFMP
jgi:hypothetical protein